MNCKSCRKRKVRTRTLLTLITNGLLPHCTAGLPSANCNVSHRSNVTGYGLPVKLARSFNARAYMVREIEPNPWRPSEATL